MDIQITDMIHDDLYNHERKKREFVLTIYGIDMKGERVVCHVKRYKPYFFVKIPHSWDKSIGTLLINTILKSREIQMKHQRQWIRPQCSLSIDMGKDFYGLYWNEDLCEGEGGVQYFKFLKISCMTYKDMKEITAAIKDYYGEFSQDISQLSSTIQEWFRVDTTSNCDSLLYEASLHPVVRFIHDTEIEPTGWIHINTTTNAKDILDTGLFGDSIEITALVEDITPVSSIGKPTSPYVIASFDIECDSSHGDFPLAYKDFKKLAADLYDSYRGMYKKLPPMIKQTFTDPDISFEYLETLMKLGFSLVSIESLPAIYKHSDINLVYTIDEASPTLESIHAVCQSICNIDFHLDTNKLPNKVRDDTIKDIKQWMKDMLVDDRHKPIRVKGDPIIQIGTVFYTYGLPDDHPDKICRHIAVIGPQENTMSDEEICSDLDAYNIVVDRCQNEAELLRTWQRIIKQMDPDFITGYNIFGFDFKYITDRVSLLFPCPTYDFGPKQGKSRCNTWNGMCTHCDTCVSHEFYDLGKMTSGGSRHVNKRCQKKHKQLNSSALGENSLNYIEMDGRILFDIQKEVQKGHNLESYKLDNVASHFMRGKLKTINGRELKVDSIGHLKIGDYVSFRTHSNIGESLHKSGYKYKICDIVDMTLLLEEPLLLSLEEYHKIEWCLTKDDITPQDIFDYHKSTLEEGGPDKRAEIAKYCIQDCELCINLLLLLDIIPNNLAMANVSYVPASFIYLRGQGIKVSSVVTRVCSMENTRIPDLKKSPLMRDYVKMVKKGVSKELICDKMIEDAGWRKPKQYELDEWYDEVMDISTGEKGMMGYEGAIVLDPKPGIYLDDPIAVMDYASLYPSSIIEKNLSHETQIEDENLLHMFDPDDYHTITYENWVYRLKGSGNTIEKVLDEKEPTKTCYFLKPEFMKANNMGDIGIIPKVLEHLLQARKDTKKRMKNETDDFKRKVLDGLQLAYKVTANSVYGQLGARTGSIFKMNIAACTTAIGRERIGDASRGVKEWAVTQNMAEPEVVYGDTDSIFVKFPRTHDGITYEGVHALQWCIDCGKQAGDYITEMIHREQRHTKQVLEYEKTFWPFILISKKRYTGDKYEFDTVSCKRDAMGIVLKRRDNAPIVKYVFGNIIEIIMMERDFAKATQWLSDTLQSIRRGEFDISYFVITKSLAGYYKNPQQIAHKVLADRMAERDPGNKPKANERIPYAYIVLPDSVLYDTENPYKSGKRKGQKRERNVMQGDRIEHVDYIRDNSLALDYEFYITNQIMNPVKQVLDLHMDPKETETFFRP